MIRMIGALFILIGAGGIGFGKAYYYHKQERQLRELYRAMELLQCEMNYTMYPVPKVLQMTAERIKGACGEYFKNLSVQIENGTSRDRSAQAALQQTRGLHLSSEAVLALLEFSVSLGNYDLDGENRMIRLSCQRIEHLLRKLEEERKPMAKSYTVLGISTGIALIILML